MAAYPPSALAGRSVEIDDVLVVAVVKGLGFWIQGATHERVFVVPSRSRDEPEVTERRVSIDGVVLHTTPAMQDRLAKVGREAPPVYVFAWAITG